MDLILITEGMLRLGMRRPIKHILNDLVQAEAGAAIRNIPLARGVTAADPYNAAQSQVNAGSAIVTFMDIQLEFLIDSNVASTTDVDELDFYIWFNIAGAQTRPTPFSEGISDLKNQIFHMGHAMMPCYGAANVSQLTNQRAIFHIPLKIPKWAQKINKDDQIELVYQWSGGAANHYLKMKVIFMEYEQS